MSDFEAIEKASIKEAGIVLSAFSERRTAIDVGAYRGTWTKLLVPELKSVIAIEPVTKNCDELDEHFREFGHVRIIRGAASDHAGPGQIDVLTKQQMAYSGALIEKIKKEQHENYAQDVMYLRLDDLGLTDVDFIKCDADGHDLRVLRGGFRLLTEQCPAVFVEVKYDKEQIQNYLASFGYKEKLAIGPMGLWFKG